MNSARLAVTEISSASQYWGHDPNTASRACAAYPSSKAIGAHAPIWLAACCSPAHASSAASSSIGTMCFRIAATVGKNSELRAARAIACRTVSIGTSWNCAW